MREGIGFASVRWFKYCCRRSVLDIITLTTISLDLNALNIFHGCLDSLRFEADRLHH